MGPLKIFHATKCAIASRTVQAPKQSVAPTAGPRQIVDVGEFPFGMRHGQVSACWLFHDVSAKNGRNRLDLMTRDQMVSTLFIMVNQLIGLA